MNSGLLFNTVPVQNTGFFKQTLVTLSLACLTLTNTGPREQTLGRGGMARQYLGCPASSASGVDRLFSPVGVAFSDKRQSAKAATLESIMFTRENLCDCPSFTHCSLHVLISRAFELIFFEDSF